MDWLMKMLGMQQGQPGTGAPMQLTSPMSTGPAGTPGATTAPPGAPAPQLPMDAQTIGPGATAGAPMQLNTGPNQQPGLLASLQQKFGMGGGAPGGMTPVGQNAALSQAMGLMKQPTLQQPQWFPMMGR
jgi:hypothetical protein